jgi:uncharacterized protein
VDDGEFQWDDHKATSNLAKHRVSFEDAKAAFNDPYFYDWEDFEQDPTEVRMAGVGEVNGKLLFVAFVLRSETIRIISARPAVPFEKRRYHEQENF